MKKLLMGIGLLTISLTLVACGGYETGDYVKNDEFKVVGNVGDHDLLKDLKTGCLYIEPQNDIGMSPYYDENGKIQGCGEGVDY